VERDPLAGERDRRAAAAALVPELDHARGADAPLPDADDPAEPTLRELGLVPDLDLEADLLRHRLRPLRELGRRQVERRGVHEVASPPLRLRDHLASLDRGLRDTGFGSSAPEDRHRGELRARAVRLRLVLIETVRAEQEALDRRLDRLL